jgi:hypothetical protein
MPLLTPLNPAGASGMAAAVPVVDGPCCGIHKTGQLMSTTKTKNRIEVSFPYEGSRIGLSVRGFYNRNLRMDTLLCTVNAAKLSIRQFQAAYIYILRITFVGYANLQVGLQKSSCSVQRSATERDQER